MKHSIRCGRCGSHRIRRSHTPLGWPQHIRRWTPLRRYACGTCGYRGWTLYQFSEPRPEETKPVSARPLEARDLRHRYARRKSVLRVSLLAVGLGAGLAYLILHAGG